MLELKITGANAHELGVNAIQTLALIVNGAAKTAHAQGQQKASVPDGPPTVDAEIVRDKPATSEVQTAEPMPNPKAVDAPVEQPKPRRGRPPTKKPDSQQIDIEQSIAATPPKSDPAKAEEPNDPLPSTLAPKHTQADCRAAVVKLYDNYIARAKAAGVTDEDAIMSGKIAYAKQLVYGFGVTKLPDLKPDQYDAFMAAAQGYIDGTTELKAVA